MKYVNRLILGIFLAMAGFSVSSAEEMKKEVGPAVGESVSINFAAPDHKGTPQDFNSVTGDKGAVVVFFRSAKWCPFCQMQLIDLNTNAREEIEKRGYKIVAVSYDKPAELERFAKKWKVGFTMLSDEGSKMIDALGLRNEDYKEGHYAHGVPHPVILVLDNDKKVVAKLRRDGYRDRPEPQVLIETLDSLS